MFSFWTQNNSLKYRTVQPVILKRKFKRNSRKIKQKVPKDIYTKVHPTGSSPAKFCGTSKIHKLPIHGTVDDLPLQPIISNVKIATYKMALYLAKLLSSLSRWESTLESSYVFVNIITQKSVPNGYKLESFVVKSVFTNIPLDPAI